MKAFLFVLGSTVLICVSRKSLCQPWSHGFFRLIAWECILALLMHNVEYWFSDPFVWNQLMAWTLLMLSLVPLVLGIQLLRQHGKPARERDGDPSLLAFEKTTQLITEGIYKFIRHPLYTSLVLLTWGIFFKHPGLSELGLAVTATIFMVFTAKADEAECIRFFGPPYQEYMKRTKMFIPYII